MSDEIVTTEIQEGIAVIRLDDGKVNALSLGALGQIHAGLDHAEKEAQSVVFAGRPGRFSAGFDLSVIRTGDASAVRVGRLEPKEGNATTVQRPSAERFSSASSPSISSIRSSRRVWRSSTPSRKASST